MRNSILLLCPLVVASALAAPAAHADINDMQDDPCQNPTIEDLGFSDEGVDLVVEGELNCLDDDQNVEIFVTAEGQGTATCTNPGGKTPKGQNPVDVEDLDARGNQSFDDDEQDGEVDFSVTAEPFGFDFSNAPHCPSPKWDEEVVDIGFTRADIEVVQGGSIVLSLMCVFAESANGEITDFECVDVTE